MKDSLLQRNCMLALIAAAAALAYLPGLWGPFFFDDLPNIIDNRLVHLISFDWSSLRDAAFSNQSGLFLRPIASLSFALNHYVAGGFDPFHFKLTNLLIHLLNGVLVFLLARGICRQLEALGPAAQRLPTGDLFPYIVAAIWVLHPLQLTSVLYVVQRMNSLAALFTFAGLLVFLAGRVRLDRGEGYGLALMLGGVAGGVVMGVLCKENAALLPVFALIIELGCFRAAVLIGGQRLRLLLFYGFVVGLPAFGAIAYVLMNPEFVLRTYTIRDFSLEERLLTQPRVLFFYLGMALYPSRHSLSLFHDDFAVSTGLFDPVSTSVSIVGWAGLIALAVYLRRSLPAIFLGVAWFLAGHMMESSVFGLEMVHEHRNYVPLFGVVFAATFAALRVLEHIRIRSRVVHAVVLLAALTLGFVTSSRAYTWSSKPVLLETLVKHRPDSPRAHGAYAAEIMRTRGDVRKAYHHLQQLTRLEPGQIVSLLEILRISKGVGLSNLAEEALPEETEDTAGIYDMPLVNNDAYLQKIEYAARSEIERRLANEPVTNYTVKAFVDLQGCVYSGASVCVRLAPDILRWVEMALDNPESLDVHRALLRITAAKLYSRQGDLDRAVEYAERSVELLPNDVHLNIQVIKLHQTLGNRDRALELINELKRKKSVFGLRSEELRQLEAQLAKAANKVDS